MSSLQLSVERSNPTEQDCETIEDLKCKVTWRTAKAAQIQSALLKSFLRRNPDPSGSVDSAATGARHAWESFSSPYSPYMKFHPHFSGVDNGASVVDFCRANGPGRRISDNGSGGWVANGTRPPKTSGWVEPCFLESASDCPRSLGSFFLPGSLVVKGPATALQPFAPCSGQSGRQSLDWDVVSFGGGSFSSTSGRGNGGAHDSGQSAVRMPWKRDGMKKRSILKNRSSPLVTPNDDSPVFSSILLDHPGSTAATSADSDTLPYVPCDSPPTTFRQPFATPPLDTIYTFRGPSNKSLRPAGGHHVLFKDLPYEELPYNESADANTSSDTDGGRKGPVRGEVNGELAEGLKRAHARHQKSALKSRLAFARRQQPRTSSGSLRRISISPYVSHARAHAPLPPRGDTPQLPHPQPPPSWRELSSQQLPDDANAASIAIASDTSALASCAAATAAFSAASTAVTSQRSVGATCQLPQGLCGEDDAESALEDLATPPKQVAWVDGSCRGWGDCPPLHSPVEAHTPLSASGAVSPATVAGGAPTCTDFPSREKGEVEDGNGKEGEQGLGQNHHPTEAQPQRLVAEEGLGKHLGVQGPRLQPVDVPTATVVHSLTSAVQQPAPYKQDEQQHRGEEQRQGRSGEVVRTGGAGGDGNANGRDDGDSGRDGAAGEGGSIVTRRRGWWITWRRLVAALKNPGGGGGGGGGGGDAATASVAAASAAAAAAAVHKGFGVQRGKGLSAVPTEQADSTSPSSSLSLHLDVAGGGGEGDSGESAPPTPAGRLRTVDSHIFNRRRVRQRRSRVSPRTSSELQTRQPSTRPASAKAEPAPAPSPAPSPEPGRGGSKAGVTLITVAPAWGAAAREEAGSVADQLAGYTITAPRAEQPGTLSLMAAPEGAVAPVQGASGSPPLLRRAVTTLRYGIGAGTAGSSMMTRQEESVSSGGSRVAAGVLTFLGLRTSGSLRGRSGWRSAGGSTDRRDGDGGGGGLHLGWEAAPPPEAVGEATELRALRRAGSSRLGPWGDAAVLGPWGVVGLH